MRVSEARTTTETCDIHSAGKLAESQENIYAHEHVEEKLSVLLVDGIAEKAFGLSKL